MKIRKWLCLLLAAAMLLCMAPALAVEAQETEEEEIIINAIDYFQQAEFQLDLTPYRDKVIALHFFSADSPDCITMLPTWKMICDDFDKETFQIVFVCPCGEEDADGCAAVAAVKETFGEDEVFIFEDRDALLCTTLGVEKTPNTLVLNMEGNPACGYEGLLTYNTLSTWLTTLNVEQLQNSFAPAAEESGN